MRSTISSPDKISPTWRCSSEFAIKSSNLAVDLLTLAATVREVWPTLGGKTTLHLSELDQAETLADRLLTAVGQREQGPAVVPTSAENRQRAFTLFTSASATRKSEIATACLRVLLPGYMVDVRCHEETPFFDAFCLVAASLLRATEPTSPRRTPTPAHPALTRELAAPAEAGEPAAEERAPRRRHGGVGTGGGGTGGGGTGGVGTGGAGTGGVGTGGAGTGGVGTGGVGTGGAGTGGVGTGGRSGGGADGSAGSSGASGSRAMRVRNVMPSRCRRPKQEEPATWRQMPLTRMGRWCSVSARWTAGNVHPVTSARAVALDRWGNANVTSAASRRQIAARRTGCAGAPMPAPPQASVFRAAFVFAAREIHPLGHWLAPHSDDAQHAVLTSQLHPNDAARRAAIRLARAINEVALHESTIDGLYAPPLLLLDRFSCDEL